MVTSSNTKASFWQTYGMHAVAYALAVLPVVQVMAPTLIPGWGTLVAAGAAGLLTLIHNVQTASANGAAPSSTVAKVLPVLLLLTAVTGAANLTGCAALSSALTTPGATQSIIQDTVQGGVIAGLSAAPASQRVSIAKSVIAAAQAVEAVDTDNVGSLSSLNTLLAQKLVKTKLDPAVQALLADAVSNAVNLLAAKVSSGTLPSATTVSVNTVLNWIIAGATPYAGS